jgi:ATP-dependent RNA helicase RhlE
MMPTTMIVLLILFAGSGTTTGFLPVSPLYASVQRVSEIPISNNGGNWRPTTSSGSSIFSSSTLLSAQAASASATDKWTETAELTSLSVIELKDLLREKGLQTSGRKSELILRLHHEGSLEATAAQQRRQQADNGFKEINVPQRLVERLSDMGLTNPTPIQKKSIPLAIIGRDVMGLAQTGTGKTLAFGVPLVAQMLALNNNNKLSRPRPKAVRGLVLAPTRELANQIAVQLRTLTEGTPINTMVVVGGKPIQTQVNKLRTGTDLLVATPGRLIDLMDRGALTLVDTTFLVLDEADLMLDMGFLPGLKKIVKVLPKKRQTMLFSATMSKNMNVVASSYLNNPVRVEIARAGKTADKITQELHYIAKPDKGDKLIDLLGNHRDDRALVFGRTKHGMEKLSKKLIAAGFKAGSIHGNKSQPQRDRAIEAFKSGVIKVLVATDVAARGLDIPDVKHVYNYELPNVPEAYVHRIGRTARAGKEGAAIAFCSMEEMDDLMAIQKVTGVKIPVVSGSAWSNTEARLAKNIIKENKQNNARPKSPKDPKKKKSSRGPSLTRFSSR